jgi:septum formation protein
VLPLVLASASPRRAELLRGAGLAFTVRATDCDEAPGPDEAPIELARRLALAKATAVADTRAIVLAADTVVWIDARTVLGKARDRDEAVAFLRTLAGRAHSVTTAWALAGAVAPEVHHETTTVWFRPLAPADIDDYLARDEWTDKAGAYGIQGAAAGFVPRIEGSYTNVVGLPLAQVLARLDELGVRP